MPSKLLIPDLIDNLIAATVHETPGTQIVRVVPTRLTLCLLVLIDGNTPNFLQSVATTRQFLYGTEGVMNAARNQGRYFASGAAALSSAAGLGASNPDGVLLCRW